jgi:hypothetical protein
MGDEWDFGNDDFGNDDFGNDDFGDDEEDDFGDDEEDDFRTESYWLGITKSPTKRVEFRNAKKAAEKIDFTPNSRTIMFTDGSFIFGDLIEAIFTIKQIVTKELHIASLAFNMENFGSWLNAVKSGAVGKLVIYVSNFYYAHEKNLAIKEAIKAFRGIREDCFQIVVSRTHCKAVFFETIGGNYITLHGSANMRSSGCAEQVMIENDIETYKAFKDYFDRVQEKHGCLDLKKGC